MPIIGVCTARQREFFRSLQRRKVPLFTHQFYSNYDMAADFLQALFMFRLEDKKGWSDRIYENIQRQTENLSPKKLREFFLIATEKMMRHEVGLSALVLPFVVMGENRSRALNLCNLISQSLLTEDFLYAARPVFWTLMITLISREDLGTWPLLIEGVYENTSGARLTFRKLCFFLATIGARIRFIGYSSKEWGDRLEDVTRSPEEIIRELVRLNPTDDAPGNRVPVPDDYVAICNRLNRGWAYADYAEAYDTLLNWFDANKENFRTAATEICENLEHPKREAGKDVTYGLRSGGADIIKIDVESILQGGVRYIQLIPKAKITEFTARIWRYEDNLEFRYFSDLVISTETIRNLGTPERATSESLLGYIALDCYWKIVSGQLFKRLRVKTTKAAKPREQTERSFPPRRPHFRWLIPGFHASDRALLRSLKTMQRLPPESKTFVKSDLTSEELVADILPLDPTHPIYTYDNEDLGYRES